MRIKKLFTIIFLAMSLSSIFGQEEPEAIEEKVEDVDFNKRKTNNIENQIVEHQTLVEKEEKFVKIKKVDTKGTYTGNLCAEEVSRKYHFVYDFDHQGNSVRNFFSNQWKIFFLTFKNGMFWRARYHRDLRLCISRSGDFIG